MTLAEPLARALWGKPDDQLGSAQAATARILAQLRADPEVLEAFAEALRKAGIRPEPNYSIADEAAVAMLDILLGAPTEPTP
jgi:hypothetical protein